jgi:serine protease Do
VKPVPAVNVKLHPSRLVLAVLAALGLACLSSRGAAAENPVPKSSSSSSSKVNIPALEKVAPENLDDLLAIQQQVKEVLKKVIPCTVGLQVGGAAGSGVIIDKEGHVLTAGHVSGTPDKSVNIILPDGKRLKGKSLGRNQGVDSGLVRITDKGPWPYLEMGKSADLKPGQWCIAVGHPGGFRPGRTPVVRLGRIQQIRGMFIRTDCALVGGDSGGPLFDLEGRVIGIHSRIGGSLQANMHVPVDSYRSEWDRLVKAEEFGGFFDLANIPYMGIQGDRESKEARITGITPGSPAEKAGLKIDDIITLFDGKKIGGYDDLAPQIRRRKIGDKVALHVLRGKETVKLELVLGKRKN